MRFFGIFAAFAAVTSVFAVPVAVPAPNAELAVKRADIVVPARISKIALDLKASTDSLIPQLEQILANPTADIEDLIQPILGQVVDSIKGFIDGVGSDPASIIKDLLNGIVGNVDGSVDSLTPQQLKDLLEKEIVQRLTVVLSNILAKFASNPEITGLIQNAFTTLQTAAKLVGNIVTALQGALGPLSSIFKGFGFN